MTEVEIIFVFLSGFATCAVVIGIPWILREYERAKAHKFLRDENARLRSKVEQARQMLASFFVNMHEFRLGYCGKALLPAPAKQVGQHTRQLLNARLTGPFVSGGPDF